jgi:hypothetical protein
MLWFFVIGISVRFFLSLHVHNVFKAVIILKDRFDGWLDYFGLLELFVLEVELRGGLAVGFYHFFFYKKKLL